MMPETTLIISGLHNLIEYSTTPERKEQKGFIELHKALLKHFFNATTVTIDTYKKEICLDISVIAKGAEVNINYDDLNTFLKSCVREDTGNITFYRNLLHYYTMTEAVA